MSLNITPSAEAFSEDKFLSIFDETIMQDEKPITKVYTLGTHTVTIRTKTTEEFEHILNYMQGTDSNTPLMIYKMNLAMLAFGLAKIDKEDFDKGTIEERIARINKMPIVKKDLLSDFLHEFETSIDDMRKKFKNFSPSLSPNRF